jgi:choline dehydrogenase-like flavoprotein
MTDFDAIVIGSGISGGWAAKELTERGLKVMMIERGPMIEHGTGYVTETTAPWDLPYRGFGDPKLFERDYPVQSKGMGFDEWTYRHFVSDAQHPYQTTDTDPFSWRRGYQLGGKSLLWGRQCYRMSDLDFGANAADGHGVDWPIRYADLAPWYDHVEDFIGVSGSRDGLPQLPDGIYQPPMALNPVELAIKARVEERWPDRRVTIGRTSNLTEPKPGRAKCQYRSICARGCSYGAYFSTQSSTLPAAQATGRLTLRTDAVVDQILHDPATGRAMGVEIIDTKSNERSRVTARVIFSCAGTINSVGVLLRSTSEAFPHGLGNTNDVLGRHLMDHALTASVIAEIPGFDEHIYFGNRPAPFIIPRFVNLANAERDVLRGYSYQAVTYRRGWPKGVNIAGVGAGYKEQLHAPGPWVLFLGAFAETLPSAGNRITLDPHAVEANGLPQMRIDFRYGANERALLARAQSEAQAMVGLVGAKILSTSAEPGPGGSAVHEMGGARMGRDPATSILNGRNQLHAVPNLFVTDGAAMASSACQNPSLTYMAMTARAAAFAVEQMQAGTL